MSEVTPIHVSTTAARRFLIEALGLTRAHPYAPAPRATSARALAEVRSLECVQLDPVAAVERRVFEYWANAACIIPIEDYWMFEGVRRRLRQRLRKERSLLRQPARQVLRELEHAGPLPSRAFTTDQRIAGYWDNVGPKTKATTHALNVLWDRGEVMVVRREGLERYFDLPERVVPPELLRRAAETDPREADRALLEKYMRAYRIFDLGDFRFGWQKIPAAQRRQTVERYVKEGVIVPLELDGVQRRYFAPAEDVGRLRASGGSARRDGNFSEDHIRFLAPLDNLLWRRERLVDLFGFAYTWEIYTPAHKRRFGYYTMPILAGDRLIGRIDPRLDREGGRLMVRLLHLEPEVKPTATLRRSLRRALEAFAGFHNAQEVVVETIDPDIRL